MVVSLTSEILLNALLIFVLRVANNAIGTVRLVSLARQQQLTTAILGFFEALIFAITMASVVTDLSNLVNLVAYCLGFSVGSFIGLKLEARFITTYMTVNIVTAERGHDIAVALREHGFGVTEHSGEGLSGEVTMLRSVVNRRDVPRILDIVGKVHPNAFVSVEEARAVQRGYIRAVRNQPY